MSVRPSESVTGGGGSSGSSTDTVYTETTNVVVTASPAIVLMDASGGNRTVELPDESASSGQVVTVKKTDSSVNTVTVSAPTGTIDGAATSVIKYENQARPYESDGTNYHIVG